VAQPFPEATRVPHHVTCVSHARALRPRFIALALLLATTALSASCGRLPATPAVCEIGQTAEIDGWSVTVLSFAALPADEWRRPDEGKIFCAVEMVVENSSECIRYVMPERQMTVLDEQGRRYSPDQDASVIAARTLAWLVPEGEFAAGASAHGAASYQIPSASESLIWVFRSSLFPWARQVTFMVGDASP
jgi:hypothetical protein